MIAKLLHLGVKALSKSKGVTPKKSVVDMPVKSKTKSIRAAKEKKAKRINELTNHPKEGSETYGSMLKRGVRKQTERTKTLERSRKPGMSKGYKARAEMSKRLSNMKRQMAKQGHTKELSQKIGDLQQKIDNSYK